MSNPMIQLIRILPVIATLLAGPLWWSSVAVAQVNSDSLYQAWNNPAIHTEDRLEAA